MGNLLAWIFLVTNLFAQPSPPGDQTGGTNDHDSPLYTVADYGTNLWLSINLSNNDIHLLLHNTQAGVPYVIRSREDLTSGSWFEEETVTGALAVTATPVTLNAGERTNSLFIQALTWMTNTTKGATIMMAIGGERIMALTASGEVISWGGNQYGELGDFTYLDSTNPVYAVGLGNIIQIAAGLNHSLALDENGTLWVWGQNNMGQLGDGGNERSTNRPAPVPGMTNIIAVAAHGYVNGDGPFGLSEAVKADGTVWMWGSGDGYWFGTTPLQIAGISNVISVAAGAVHALALKTDGTVWAWGVNHLGQLGDGNQQDSDVPGQVIGLSNIVGVCAGDYHTLALASNGIVWAWGYNCAGQLGDGGGEDYSDAPVMVVGLTNVVEVAAGGQHSLALDGKGRLWAWGADDRGQLGDGGSGGRTSLPIQVPGMSNIVSAAAGSDASAALDNDGKVWQWGDSDGDDIDWPWGNERGCPIIAPAEFDFYNGQLPDLTILNGNHQTLHAGLAFAQPLAFRVTDTNGLALSNAPVSIEVIGGDMQLRTVSDGNNYKGLRLITDGDGEVSLIGYADRYAFNSDCLVRVLAASRGRIAVADFSETLVPPPTISITSPADGGTYLVGTNRPLTITVAAESAPGSYIQEVDYYYQTHDSDAALLGVSTQNPFSFAWINDSWWAGAFVCQYALSAVAIDDAGAQSDPQSVNITVALDSDGNGMADYWQLANFGHLGVDPGADPDGDGISNLQECQNASDPMDYYNGSLPHLEILGGNDQAGNYDSFLPQPIGIKISDSEFYTTFLANAPVTFTVACGTALLAASTNDIPTNSIVLRSDSNGSVSAWLYFPPAGSNPPDSTIFASAASGANSLSVTVNEFVPMGHWRFDNTNTWVGEGGQLPLLSDHLVGVPCWSSNAVSMDNVNPALLSYNVMETNGSTNINCRAGTILFWFKPDWSSAGTGGTGPGTWGRLFEMGSYNSAFTNGWWGLYLSPDGTQLLFGTSTNGSGMTNLSANISWYSSEWYQIALTYSPTGSALYVDGQLLANGAGVTCVPNLNELTNGFRIGSDQGGDNQAGGAFDELETFNYPLAAGNTCTQGSEIPDWWEVKYFNRVGMDPNFAPAGDGYNLLIDYQRGRDPNIIQFHLEFPGSYVSANVVTGSISIIYGEPSYMAVLVNETNQVTATWRAYSPNVVVDLDAGDGDYSVFVGLRGLPPNAAQTWLETTLTLDTVPPVLAVTAPVSGTVSQPMIQLQGWVTKALSRLTYDVSNAVGVFTNQIGCVIDEFYDTNLVKFTTNYFLCYDISLMDGLNTITLQATDLAGNTTTTNISYTLDYSGDTMPPVLSVGWPQNGTRISGSNFTMQAQVDDVTAKVTASIVDSNGDTNIVQGLVESGGAVWVNHLPLSNGTNWLTLTATDVAGNASTTNLNVICNDVGLVIDPLTSSQLNQSSVTVTGSINDPGGTVSINGVAATVNGDGGWVAENVPVSPTGTAGLFVQVGDGSGNSLAAQSVYHVQPAMVGLVSYSSNKRNYSSTVNEEDNSVWTPRSGGYQVGHYIGCGSWIPFQPPTSNVWNAIIPPGFSPDWYGTSFDAYHFWEEASINVYLNGQQESDETRTRVMIEPSGQASAGATRSYLVQAQAWDFYDPCWAPVLALPYDLPLPASAIRIQGLPLVDNGSGAGEIILQAAANAKVDVTPMAPGNYLFTVRATELGICLAVDNNRDGQINFDNSDATTPAKPYRFWINDSKESGDISSADNDIPGSDTLQSKVIFPRVNGPSDAVNFFPAALCLSNALQSFPTWAGYEYHLSQKDGAIDFVYADLCCTNAFEYLTSSEWWNRTHGDDLYNFLATHVTPSPGVTLNEHFLNRILANGENGVIMVEGIKATKRPLELEIWYNDRKIAAFPMYLSISRVEDMYRHLDLRDGPDTPTGLVGQTSSGDWTKASQMNDPAAFPDCLCNDKWLVFVHGYNVSGQEARGWESEVFKRFYWSHNYARFVGVAWFGDPRGKDGDYLADYHWAVMNAFATATKFAEKIGALAGPKTIVAHSLGCGVVASAIADHDLKADHACFLDAALAAECFDGDAAEDLPNMAHPSWVSSVDPSQPYYPRQLWASDWYKLFLGTDDARKTLTWKNRFANVMGKTDIHSFYSSTEDVLAPCPGMPGPAMLQSLLTSRFAGAYAWTIQEKGKGNAISVPWAIQAGSDYGGWGFNIFDGYLNCYPTWYVVLDCNCSRRVKTPAEIGTVTEDMLGGNRYNPLFDNGWGAFNLNNASEIYVNVDTANFTGPTWIMGLYTSSGGNTIAADPAKRTQLLAEAIPALSTPTGSRFVYSFDAEGNYDMPVQYADQTHWPRGNSFDTIKPWFHSDMHDVAYLYLYKLYNQIVSVSQQ